MAAHEGGGKLILRACGRVNGVIVSVANDGEITFCLYSKGDASEDRRHPGVEKRMLIS
jgi:hypothetical protein